MKDIINNLLIIHYHFQILRIYVNKNKQAIGLIDYYDKVLLSDNIKNNDHSDNIKQSENFIKWISQFKHSNGLKLIHYSDLLFTLSNRLACFYSQVRDKNKDLLYLLEFSNNLPLSEWIRINKYNQMKGVN